MTETNINQPKNLPDLVDSGKNLGIKEYPKVVLLFVGLSLIIIGLFNKNGIVGQVNYYWLRLHPVPTLYYQKISPYPTKVPQYTLVSNGKDNSEILRTDRYSNTMFALWKDILFWTDESDNNLQVYAYNPETKIKTVVFNREEYFKGERKEVDSFGDFQVIGNELYFSFAAYLRGSYGFWVKLPSYLIIPADYSGSIARMNGRYWIINGMGDACWGSASYSLLNISTKKINKVFDSVSGCIDGDEFIGIDGGKDRIIAGSHVTWPSSLEVNSSNQLFTSLFAIPINNPKSKTALLDKDKIPEGVYSVLLDGDVVYLQADLGREKYMCYQYRLVSQSLEPGYGGKCKFDFETVDNSPSNDTWKKVRDLLLPELYSVTIQ